MEAALPVIALGFLGQGLFGARLVVQLFQSEKQKRVVSPVLFWQLSLGGSFLFLVYGILRMDAVIILGQLLSYFIYIRNLQLKNVWRSIFRPVQIALLVLPFAVLSAALFINNGKLILPDTANFVHPVIVLGTIGQLALNLRFVYQWYYSEKHKTSLLPVGFWQISVWASVLVICYSLFHPVYGVEPVLLVSQTMGITVYIRNLVIFRKQKTFVVQNNTPNQR